MVIAVIRDTNKGCIIIAYWERLIKCVGAIHDTIENLTNSTFSVGKFVLIHFPSESTKFLCMTNIIPV